MGFRIGKKMSQPLGFLARRPASYRPTGCRLPIRNRLGARCFTANNVSRQASPAAHAKRAPPKERPQIRSQVPA